MEKNVLAQLAERLKHLRLDTEIRVMEVCGTHTTEFFKTGVRDIFPNNLTLIDGPGCPVCVTTNEYLDRAIEISRRHGAVLATFGDMIKVPSSYSSLTKERAQGMAVEVVYSPMNALELAAHDPSREIVFLSVGFETTAPLEAVAVLEAKSRGIGNFSILPGNKLTVPAVKALLELGEARIDAFIIPGHVSAVIGAAAWREIPEKFGRPCVISGFQAQDLITGMLAVTGLVLDGRRELVNDYPRAVKKEGNRKAQEIMFSVFEPADADWRGIGTIPGSGLAVRGEFAAYDASQKFPVTVPEPREHRGCRCGELLRGLILPPDCSLFGTACTPSEPVGPCMVSTEGPCSAYYKYWR
ncbi:MAG: hydrogenase formation protein HypD [Spirochaetes bacterium]|nr:hydrogenase formation protein HypD [Spirochaetota bacterium]